MSFAGSGGLVDLIGLFKPVIDFLKRLKESREVQHQLDNALQSLTDYHNSQKAIEKSGKAFRATLKGLNPPISRQQLEDLVGLWIEFTNDFSDLLSSVRAVGRDCKSLVGLEGLMEKVKEVKKHEVYDVINVFARSYDRKTDTLDLGEIPTLVRIYGKKAGWRESGKLSKTVEEGKEEVSGALEKARAISKQRLRIDRHLAKEFFTTLRRFAREGKGLKASKEAQRELRRNAPSWFVEITEAVETVQKAIPELSGPTIRRFVRR